MTVYEKINELLRERNLSRRQLALAADIPPTSFQSAMARGGNMSIAMLQKIADALDVKIEEFFSDREIYDARAIAQSVYPDDEEKAAEIVSSVLNDTILDQNGKIINEAIEKSDDIYLRMTKSVPESYLRLQLLEEFKYLNKRGKLEAINMLMWLNENPRYHKNDK